MCTVYFIISYLKNKRRDAGHFVVLCELENDLGLLSAFVGPFVVYEQIT